MSQQDSSPSSSSLHSSEKTEAINKAAELLSQGKRNMVCGEITKAVNLYEEAVRLLVNSCGELSRDCADAYFSCGSALLELGRMEASVLGTAIEPDVEGEKEEDVNEQPEEPAKSDAPEEAEVDADEENIEDNQEGEENTEDNQEGEEVDGEDKEEDVPSFQLAWEYLDLAKVIYLKSESQADQLKAAECYNKLGELSMESEQHVTAAEDIESALKIHQKLLPGEDRQIAETHYQLGLAYGLGKEFQLAIQHYSQAIGVMEAKIASLNKLVAEAVGEVDNKENESDQVNKYQDEIRELQELIPEMRNKIEDAEEEAKDMEKMKQIAKEALGFSSHSKKCESPTKRVGPSVGDKVGDVDENGERKPNNSSGDDDVGTAGGQRLKKVKCDEEGTVNGTAAGQACELNKSEPTSADQIPS